MSTWNETLEFINKAISSRDFAKEEIAAILANYESKEEDWRKFALRNLDDKSPNYTRILVAKGDSEYYNLLLLVWPPGSKSLIHGHAGASCFVKMLKGALTEFKFDWPKSQPALITGGEFKPPIMMIEKGRKRLDKDSVSFMSDEIGLHRMENSGDSFSVSLHVYAPAFKACKIFHQEQNYPVENEAEMNFWTLN